MNHKLPEIPQFLNLKHILKNINLDIILKLDALQLKNMRAIFNVLIRSQTTF